MTAREYIDTEFAEMLKMGIRGPVDPGLEAVLKMVFLSGIAAGGAYSDRESLRQALKPALNAICEQYGGRVVFPFTWPEPDTGDPKDADV